jgi:predicted phage-related endonuclease
MGESRDEMHRIEEVNRYTKVLYSPIDLREEAKIFPEEQQIIVKSGEYLGASEVNVIMNQKYRSIYNLAQEKVGIIPKKDVDNQFTRYGQEIEPYIINHIEKQGYIFNVEKKRCHDYKFSGIVDGIDKEKEVILEVKTYFNNPDFESYVNQIHVYFHIWNYKKAILAIYQKDDKFDYKNIEIYNILKDNERIENILKSVEMFWNKCNILKLNPEMKKKEFDNLEV